MSYNQNRATTIALNTLSDLSRIFTAAVAQKQDLEVDLKAGMVGNERLDETYDIHIVVGPPK